MIWLICIQLNALLCPLVENPLHDCWIAVHGSFVQRVVAVIVLRPEYLIKLVISLGLFVDLIYHASVLVGTFCADAHECKLMHSYLLGTSAANSAHSTFLLENNLL